MREHAAIGKCQPSCDRGCGIANNALADQAWRWEACLRKALHQTASNIGTGYGRNKGCIHGREATRSGGRAATGGFAVPQDFSEGSQGLRGLRLSLSEGATTSNAWRVHENAGAITHASGARRSSNFSNVTGCRVATGNLSRLGKKPRG